MVAVVTSALIVGDVHLTDESHKPTSRTATYTQDILDKLQFCVEKANELDVPIVQAGDMFHLKASSKNSHKLVQRTHEVLKEAKRGVWVVPGNHDMQGNRLQSLFAQPLGSLCRMRNVNLLIGETDALPGIAGVPYITQFDGGVWQAQVRDYYEDFDIVADSPTLLVTHAPIFPPGQAPGVYASIDPDDWADFWIGIVATYYGHIHDCHGTFMDSKKTMEFCNQGALSRGSLHESSLTRKPAITLWDGTSFTRIEVPHKAPEEVFLLAEAAQKVENKASAEQFAHALSTATVQSLTPEELIATIKADNVNPKVIEIIETVLEEVR